MAIGPQASKRFSFWSLDLFSLDYYSPINLIPTGHMILNTNITILQVLQTRRGYETTSRMHLNWYRKENDLCLSLLWGEERNNIISVAHPKQLHFYHLRFHFCSQRRIYADWLKALPRVCNELYLFICQGRRLSAH